jgi:hypothetical protein
VYGRDYFLQQDFDPKILSVLAAHKNDFILRNFHASGVNSRSCAFLQKKRFYLFLPALCPAAVSYQPFSRHSCCSLPKNCRSEH